MAIIWQETLGLEEQVMPWEDFFELGGDSVRALLVVQRVRNDFGRRISVAAFLEHPTVESLAALCRTTGGGVGPSLVRVRKGAPGLDDIEPMVFVHAASGEVLFLNSLAADALPGPIWGIRSVGIDGDEEPLRSVEDMASRYADALRQAQFNSYTLVGYSGGGLIALELARLLEQSGHAPNLLVLLDPPSLEHTSVPVGAGMDELLLMRVRQLGRIYGLDANAVGSPESAWSALRDVGGLPPTSTWDDFERALRIWATNVQAFDNYVPTKPVETTTLLYQVGSADHSGPEVAMLGDLRDSYPAPDRPWWRQLLHASTRVRTLPVDHFDLIRSRDTALALAADVYGGRPALALQRRRSE